MTSILPEKDLENYIKATGWKPKKDKSENGKGDLDMPTISRFLEQGKYTELKNVALFNSVRTCFDSIQGANELDFDPEFLYQKSISI